MPGGGRRNVAADRQLAGRGSDSIGPTKNRAAGTSRDPSALRSATDPSSSSSTAGISRGRVGVHEAAHGRAPVADRRVGHVAQSPGAAAATRRTPPSSCSSRLCRASAPTVTASASTAHAVEAGHVVDVDQVLGRRQPHREQRHQALPAREHLAALAQPGEDVEGLVEAARPVVGERGRLHVASYAPGSCAAGAGRVAGRRRGGLVTGGRPVSRRPPVTSRRRSVSSGGATARARW